MRITGGTARGRNLVAPKSGCRFIRPTGDRVREALFSILSADIPGSTVLDLYAGTGALGMEALSRGAVTAVFVDQSRQALQLIRTNLGSGFSSAKAALLRLDLDRPQGIRRLKKKLPLDLLFDLIFLDPPYEKKLAATTLKMVEQASIVRQQGLVVAEDRKNISLAEQYGILQLIDRRVYGETGIWIYRRIDPKEHSSFSNTAAHG